jgi:hypothetical protein
MGLSKAYGEKSLTGYSYGAGTGGDTTSTGVNIGGTLYNIHTFTASGTFTVTRPGKFDVLCVAGGGGAASGGSANNLS